MSTATMTGAPTGVEQSAADLLLAISDGDASAWKEILRRYGGLVAAAARSFRLQDSDTFDVVQTTWLRLVENHHQVRSPEHLGGWLVTTARRECLRILRDAKRIVPTDATSDGAVDLCAGPEQQAIDTLTARTLHNLLAELTPRQQALLRALFVDDIPYTHVARITGVPHGSIGPTRMRALARLRRKLDEYENPEVRSARRPAGR